MQLADEIVIIENGMVKTKGRKEDVLPSLMNELSHAALKSRC